MPNFQVKTSTLEKPFRVKARLLLPGEASWKKRLLGEIVLAAADTSTQAHEIKGVFSEAHNEPFVIEYLKRLHKETLIVEYFVEFI